MIRGTGVSPGIAVGKSLVYKPGGVPVYEYRIPNSRIDAEIRRLEGAIRKSKEQLSRLKDRLDRELGKDHAYIFDAQILMLEDEILVEETKQKIRKEKMNSEWALKVVTEEMREKFSKFADKYIQERFSDVMDVTNRVRDNLSGRSETRRGVGKGDFILVAHDLSPSDTAQLDRTRIKGIAIDAGGPTSHTSILAKSLQIPAVVGLHDITSRVQTGQLLVLDGSSGDVVVNPSVGVKKEFLAKKQSYEALARALLKNRDLPPVTKDGYEIKLAANIEFPWDVNSALEHGAQGVGLYRTEYLLVENYPDPPDEEEHYRIYKELGEQVTPHAAVVRTFDIGGDKLNAYLSNRGYKEANPIMGLRAIRFCFRQKEIFKTQLKAILRAAVHGDLKILFPLISSLDELRKAKEILQEAKEELRAREVPYRKTIEVGIMMEVPAAATIADLLAKEADFFSIGTNDLIQYCLAIDRSNENVSYLYEPVHPGILRTLKTIVDAAHKNDIPVGICGEMAADPWLVALHLGLGVDDLSMTPNSLPLIKKIVRELNRKDAKKIVESVLNLPTGREVEEVLFEKIAAIFPHGFFLKQSADCRPE